MVMAKTEAFVKTRASAPPFKGRIDYISNQFPPIRAYIHKSGTSAWLPKDVIMSIENEVKPHLISSLNQNLELIQDADFLLAALWENDKDKMIDLFKYTDTKKWPGNPEVSAYVLKNSVYVPEKREITCGDTLIVLGLEETHRRTTTDLTDYMEHPIEIEGLMPFVHG